MRSTWITWSVLALIVLITAGLRTRLLAIPLERDEGEYAYIAQLILQGEVPFTQAYTMKYPGVPYVYAAFLAVFGQTDVAIHLGLLIINAASVVLVFLLGKRLFDPTIGLIAAGAFGLLSLSHTMLGFTANTEHFVILPMLAALLLLLRFVERQRWVFLFGLGLLFGIAVLMKQHAAIFAVFGAVYLVIQELAREDRSQQRLFLHLFLFSAAAVFPVALLWLYLWNEGAFAPFWFWTFTYPRHYASMVPFKEGLGYLIQHGIPIVGSFVGLWGLALVGAAATLCRRAARQDALFLILFTGFSFLAVCPGLFFRPHYFLLVVPAVSLWVGVGAAALGQLCSPLSPPIMGERRVAVLFAFLAFFSGVWQQYHYLILRSPLQIFTAIYRLQPFNEMRELAHYIQDHSQLNDCIAVIGSEPETYFYARRRAATKFLYVYPLMEPQPYALQMQKDMIAEIERQSPRFLVFVSSRLSWLPNPSSPHLLWDWFSEHYVREHYRRVVVADTLSSDRTEYFWGTEAISYTPRGSFVVLYERLPASRVR